MSVRRPAAHLTGMTTPAIGDQVTYLGNFEPLHGRTATVVFEHAGMLTLAFATPAGNDLRLGSVHPEVVLPPAAQAAS